MSPENGQDDSSDNEQMVNKASVYHRLAQMHGFRKVEGALEEKAVFQLKNEIENIDLQPLDLSQNVVPLKVVPYQERQKLFLWSLRGVVGVAAIFLAMILFNSLYNKSDEFIPKGGESLAIYRLHSGGLEKVESKTELAYGEPLQVEVATSSPPATAYLAIFNQSRQLLIAPGANAGSVLNLVDRKPQPFALSLLLDEKNEQETIVVWVCKKALENHLIESLPKMMSVAFFDQKPVPKGCIQLARQLR